MSKRFSSKVECYDCHQYVYNLKEHRNVCVNTKKKNKNKNKRLKKGSIIENTRDFYFLLDVSGSMAGYRLSSSKSVLKDIETSMSETDRIAVVTFDNSAYFKLKPRPVGQIRRQKELEPLLSRIYAQGLTAIWDAIYLSISQIRDKQRDTLIIVLTDGDDNSSSHTYEECILLLDEYINVTLNIIHIENTFNSQYDIMARDHGRGDYILIEDTEIITTIKTTFKKYYIN